VRFSPELLVWIGSASFRALLYALAIAALVLFAQAEPHGFIYEGF